MKNKIIVFIDILLTLVILALFFSSCRRILGVEIDSANYYIGYSNNSELFLSVLELLFILFLGFIKIIFLVKEERFKQLNIAGLSIIFLSFSFLWFNLVGVVLLAFLCKKLV